MSILIMNIFNSVLVFLFAVTTVGSWQPFQKELTSIRDCDDILKHIKKRKIHSPSPPYLNGNWVSQRCEIRSGPEFLLRKYTFDNLTSVFEARQYYYTDPDCHHPSHLIVARGNFGAPRPQFLSPEVSEMDYKLSHVTVMAYTRDAARRLSSLVNQSCPGSVTFPWILKKPYAIFEFNEFEDRVGGNMFLDVDCTSALNFSLHELQLLRMDILSHHHHELKEIFFGDVHSVPNSRKTYRPTSFQIPLLEMKNHGCGATCRALSKATDVEPPTLHRLHTVSLRRLYGEWVSTGCESRPNGQYLTRKVTFDPTKGTWSGVFQFARDPWCEDPSFTLSATGYYYHESHSSIMENTENFRFRVDKLAVTPEDELVTYNLNDKIGCGQNVWVRGVEQDVTVTKGCVILGIKIPYIEFEVVRLEKNRHGLLLALGKRPSDGSSPNSPLKRATAFQSPLMRCNYDEKQASSIENESKYWERLRGASQRHAPWSLSTITIAIGLLVIVL